MGGLSSYQKFGEITSNKAEEENLLNGGKIYGSDKGYGIFNDTVRKEVKRIFQYDPEDVVVKQVPLSEWKKTA